ncbi:hypothetical protein [Corynebacterium sp.]|nr:hypothetical protein [Corynebacterium sp.]MDY5785118.1 hypothetical protein [Corynebacterium sp.]
MLLALSPWIQLPIVLAVVLPLAGVAGLVLLRVIDAAARVFRRRERE